MNRSTPFLPFLFSLIFCAGFVEAEVVDVVEGHHRAVWLRDVGDGKDVFGKGSQHLLMGYDSQDGIGIRQILPETASYSKPLLTPRGDQIVYTDFPSHKTYVVNFDGSGKVELANGFGAEVWMQPGNGKQFVMVASGAHKVKSLPGYDRVVMVQVDNPRHQRQLWAGDWVAVNNFQISRDGRYAAAQFPWPHGGVADLATGTWKKTTKGCWTSMSPDNNYVSWVFDGPHRNVTMHWGSAEWMVAIDKAPGINGREVYHPRWSNHARYIVMTGPYAPGKVVQGGKGVEVYIGRLDSAARKVEAWQALTDDEEADFFPDLWVAGGERAELQLTEHTADSVVETGVKKVKGLLIEASPVPAPEDLAAYKSCLILCHYRLPDGDEIAAYHWGVKERKILPGAAREEGKEYDLELVRFESRKDLKGIRTAELLTKFDFEGKWMDQADEAR